MEKRLNNHKTFNEKRSILDVEDNPDISIVIPAYNEEERIPLTLEKIIDYLDSHKYSFEIIVVNDGSRDNTVKVVKECMKSCAKLRLLHNLRKTGKGFSVKKGMFNSHGKYVFFSDADLSTPIEEIEKLLFFLKNNYDVVFGSRCARDSQVLVRATWYRDALGRVFGFLLRHIVLPWVKDSQCGFKGFRKDVISDLFNLQRLNGFAFDVEILFIARKLGLSTKEIGVRWINSPKSKLNPVIDSFKMLIELFKVRFNDLFGKYSLE